MAHYVVKLSAPQKAQLEANQPVTVSVGAGQTRDSFVLDPRHQPGFMQHMWDEQDLGNEVYVLAEMETNPLMREIEVVP